MKTGEASGLQITFLVFAVLLLVVPLNNWLGTQVGVSGQDQRVLGRSILFGTALLILFGIPALRRQIGEWLEKPVPAQRRTESLLVILAQPTVAFASVGALAFWYWFFGGTHGLEQKGLYHSPEREAAHAFSAAGFIHLFIAVLVGPLVEELIFRGFLLRTWKRRWGWLPSMLLTSAAFAIFHPIFLSAFLSGMVFACLVLRTGSLWAAIAAHAMTNLGLWYPFFGQFVFPTRDQATGDIFTYSLHLACLLFVFLALPVYVFMSRHAWDEPAEVAAR